MAGLSVSPLASARTLRFSVGILGALTLLVIASWALVAAPISAQGVADEYNPDPDFIWDAQTEDPNAIHTGNLRAVVFDFEELDGVMYVGGQFLEMRSGAGTVVSRPYMAALNVASGALITSFNPTLDGPVYSIETTSDNKLIVGGEFTGGLAVIDPTTGARDTSFAPDITKNNGRPAIWDIEVVGNKLYVAGLFNRVRSQVKQNLARINYPSSALDAAWTTTSQGIDDGSRHSGNPLVWNIAVDPGRSRVYIVGKFDSINDTAGTDNFATVNMTNGALTSGLPQGDPIYALNHDRCSDGTLDCWHYDNYFYDVQVDGANVYIGGEAHQTIRMDANDLSVQNFTFTNKGLGDTFYGGDTQVILVGSDTIWSGCHCWGSVGEFAPLTFEMHGDQYRDFVTAFGTVSNQKVRANFGLTRTGSQLTPQVFNMTGQSGTWALAEDSFGRLWSGGQYTSGGGRTITGLARFSPSDGVGPVAPTACVAANSNGDLTISWTRAANDNATSFVIRRSRNGGSFFWTQRVNTPGTSWTDTNVTAGASYRYTVETHSGNERSTILTCAPSPIVAGAGQAAVAPVSCWATRNGDDLDITWSRATDDNAAFSVIYRSKNGGPLNWSGRVDSPTRAWTNSDPGAGTYEFRVETVGTNGTRAAKDCGPNNGVTIDQPAGSDAKAPLSCWATRTATGINITWTRAGADSATAFVVRRSRNGGQYYWTGRVDAPARSWLNATPAAGTYRYQVETIAANGTRATKDCGPDNGVTI